MDNKNGDFCLATSKVCDFLMSDCGHVIVCKVFDWPVFLYSWGYNTTCSLGKHLTPLEVVFGVFMWTEMFFQNERGKILVSIHERSHRFNKALETFLREPC